MRADTRRIASARTRRDVTKVVMVMRVVCIVVVVGFDAHKVDGTETHPSPGADRVR